MGVIVRFVISATMVLPLLLASAAPVSADFATYTETVTATGTLGGVRFNDALVTLTTTADTANITSPVAGFSTLTGTPGSVTIAGTGSATFSFDLIVFSNQISGVAGIEAHTTGSLYADVIDTINPTFATYDLSSSIGPVTGTAFTNGGPPFATSSGALVITSTSSSATFLASTAAVPEPSSFAMCGLAGVIGLVVARVRRKRPA
jgi:hypothetical protein